MSLVQSMSHICAENTGNNENINYSNSLEEGKEGKNPLYICILKTSTGNQTFLGKFNLVN